MEYLSKKGLKMNKRIWIFNHYAIEMYFNEGGRHYWFAKYLKRKGYEVTIFSSNIRHNSKDVIEIEKGLYKSFSVNEIDFVFIKSVRYSGNGFKRVLNMISFYRNLIKTIKRNFIQNKPDIILASSVHPLTLIAGIKIKKILSIPLISEIRDLWPESLVAYGYLRRKSILAKFLYYVEKKIYIKSDHIIMTWEGGKDYIKNQRWEKAIPLKKINYISNGFDSEDFNNHIVKYIFKDKDLENQNTFKIVYTGSVRKVNNISFLIDVAKELMKHMLNITFIIFGTGEDIYRLKQRLIDEKIINVVFKGQIKKKYIPSVLAQADLLILHYKSTSLDQYGQSQNKLFEYIASKRPIIQTYKPKYSIIEKHGIGLSTEPIVKKVVDGILYYKTSLIDWKVNPNNLVYKKYDFVNLTQEFERLINKAFKGYKYE